MAGEYNAKRVYWYQTVWGVALLGLGALVAFFVIIFSVLTIRYWWQIGHGKGKILQQQFYSGFTTSSAAAGSGAAVSRKTLEGGDHPYLGGFSPDSPVVIVAFMDFKCPNSKAAAPILQDLADKYGFKTKIIIRNFPGETIHPGATQLAQLAVCAYMQGKSKYWSVYDMLFAQQDQLGSSLSDAEIQSIAGDYGLNYQMLADCMKNQADAVINSDMVTGVDAGVSGTPTFFVNGEMVEGVVPLDVWDGFIKNY